MNVYSIKLILLRNTIAASEETGIDQKSQDK